jgi:hypothetical protein|tara:strand:+ start:2141 stop:2599 length:459 start_codon:yes stop_codon:yes gene_type:complete
MATISGAATAAGVPKPEAPSMNDPKSQAKMTTWTLLSSLILLKLRRIAETPPDLSRVFNRNRAPKIISSKSKVVNNPSTDEAATFAQDMSQNMRAIAAAVRYTNGIAILAGVRKPTNNAPARRMGRAASTADIPELTGTSLRMLECFLLKEL